ncbi:hypothetical protein FACS1894201_08050 [Bacteroidia bacterium]|nr:hypothetical protein FACS1894201_08050 [Bacteroidia bacterium]
MIIAILWKFFFLENFPQFEIRNKYAYGIYWELLFAYEYVKIKIGGDWGFGIELEIDSSKYDLWRYDRSVSAKTKTTEVNIMYQLNVLKRFLNEVGY